MRLPISSWGIWKTARFFRRRPKRQVPRLRTRQLAREQLEDRTLLATVSLDAYSGMQEGYSASIAVYRDDSAGDLTVSFFTSDYSAEPGDYQLYDGNFQPVTSSLTFYDGQSSTSLWIYAPTDADGDDESFAIQLSDTGQYMVDSYNSSAFVEIWDSSGSASGVTPTVWLESDLTISEGNSGDLVFRRDTFEGDLTVNFQSTNVTAEADDYGLMSNSVTFYDGWDSASVSLWTTNDADGDDEVIQIDVADGGGAYFVANGATVTIEDFEPPVATDNVYATLEDNALAGNVLTDNTGAGVDFDPNGGPVTLNTFATWGPYYGSLTLAADGAFTYQPYADFNGTDSFGYTIFDEDAQSGSATVTIWVDPDNDPPAASGGYTIYVDEDSSTSSMVSAWDIDGDSLTYGVAPGGDPAHGTLDLNEWGSFSYTPFENYHGSDSFTFQVADPTGPPVTAEIMITVDPVNDAPTAGDDIATTDENQSLALSDLLANDADLDGDSLMVASFDSSTSMGGGVSDNGNGTLFYTPPVGFVGTDTFTYTATDGHGGYASATVTVTVLQQPEVWMDAPASLMENGIGEFTLHRNRSEGELTVTLTGYDNTSEPGDYALPGSVTFAQGVTSMQVLFQAHDDADPDDELFYPAISEAGSYAIGGMSCALVTILDDDPQSVWFESSSATIVEPSSSGFSSSVALMLTRNTSEGELTVLYHVVGSAEAGDYTISPSDSVTFYDGESSTTLWITPEDDQDGDDEQLGIQIQDDPAYMASNSASITLEDREAPVATAKEYFSFGDGTAQGNLLTDDTGNGQDSDPNGDALTVETQPYVSPMNGSITISSNGDFTYTAYPGFQGTDSFVYTVVDYDGQTSQATVTIVVTNYNNRVCTLRAAIAEANAHDGHDTINFDIGGESPINEGIYVVNSTGDEDDANAGDGICEVNGGMQGGAEDPMHVIAPQSALPVIISSGEHGVTIDGTSQPDYVSVPTIWIDGNSAGDSDGFVIQDGNTNIKGLFIYQFNKSGIYILESDNTTITENFIGLDPFEPIALGNKDSGITIQDGSGNRIGGTGTNDRNVISGNEKYGILIYASDAVATDNHVVGNYIGTDAEGDVDFGNNWDGVSIASSAGAAAYNYVGTDGDGTDDDKEGNVISGNTLSGVSITGSGSTGNVVAGNKIGTDLDATDEIKNNYSGIAIESGATENRVGTNGDGTSDTDERNIISGNGLHGIYIHGALSNVLAGNYIGVTASGDETLANQKGILLNNGDENRIGTDSDGSSGDADEGNVIAGNSFHGIHLSSGSDTNTIAGNHIGTNVAGADTLGNGRNGVHVDGGSNNIIGYDSDVSSGDMAGNVIAFNSSGVEVTDGAGNSIRRNSIFQNRYLGIDLVGEVGSEAGDVYDTDTGANGLQNFPLITDWETTDGITHVQGILHSTPEASFTVEIFSNDADDPLGFGEGQTFHSDVSVTTAPDGDGTFSVEIDGEVAHLSATATNIATHDTSEFGTRAKVNVTIYRGGNSENEVVAVPDEDEESIGAFTVANLNNTDGDNTADWEDDFVVATEKGRDEVDLMRLDIDRPEPYHGGPVTIRVLEGLTDPSSGTPVVKFWEHSTKGTPITVDESGEVKIDGWATHQQQTIWVEATTPSPSVRNIVIEAEYAGAKDTVKATAIWASLVAVEHDKREHADVLQDPEFAGIESGNPIRSHLEVSGGTGLRPFQNNPGMSLQGLKSVILMKFLVEPAGIQNEPDVLFDVTRRRDEYYYIVKDGEIFPHPAPLFPLQNEEPNDASNDYAESDEPNADGEIFSMDGPGFKPQDHSNDDFFSDVSKGVVRTNFEEFVRVRFDGTDPTGEVIVGTRASEKFPWHARQTAQLVDGYFKVRSTGDTIESDDNDIGPGHIDLGV